MIDLLRDFAFAVLQGAGTGIRWAVAIVAVLLVLRSLCLTFLPRSAHRFIDPLLRLTECFSRPVSQALPTALRSGRPDYPPLVAALYLLVFGYGLSHFFLQLAAVF